MTRFSYAARWAALAAFACWAAPALSDADEVFQVLRAARMARMAPLLRAHRDQIKATLAWNIEKGVALSGEQIAVAQTDRAEIFGRVKSFLADGRYVGGEFGWLSPFALICGVGLCLGYTLLGACWLVRKCEGELRELAYRLIPYLSIALLVFLIVVFAYALAVDLRIIGRWLERPYLFVFPSIGVVAAIVLAVSVRTRRDSLPFYMVALIFTAAFGTLAISFWPYMIPFSITVEQAAAPHSSLAFMFWGEGLFVFPLMLIYTVISYAVFRGKVAASRSGY